jgi:RNA polymerase subunit RPABC4/transcription elongation factor Spt4
MSDERHCKNCGGLLEDDEEDLCKDCKEAEMDILASNIIWNDLTRPPGFF